MLAKSVQSSNLRSDWSLDEILALFHLPFNDLLFEAQRLHRQYFAPNQVQVSSLLNIKTGGCSEDCSYCSQSARYDTGLERERLMALTEVVESAKTAKANGASRFCMGAAWRSPKDHQIEFLCDMVKEVKALGMETCMTLGMLTDSQTQALGSAGLDYYNHNLDTSPEHYPNVITTRTYQDRLDTLARVRKNAIKVCSGGILGLGENQQDRASLLQQLSNLNPHPESVPINMLVPIEGTPLAQEKPVDPIEFVRTIAVARILMPQSFVRLSAGRTEMSDELQALCFFAGANSIFYGEKLLTTPNQTISHDHRLFEKLGLTTA